MWVESFVGGAHFVKGEGLAVCGWSPPLNFGLGEDMIPAAYTLRPGPDIPDPRDTAATRCKVAKGTCCPHCGVEVGELPEEVLIQIREYALGGG